MSQAGFSRRRTMNLYNVTIYDDHKNENHWFSIVARDIGIATATARKMGPHKGEATLAKVQQHNLIVV